MPEPKITFPEPETLTETEKLSDEQLKSIADLKDSDWNEPAKAEDKPKEEPRPEPEKKEEEPPAKTTDELAAEKQKQEAEAAETQRIDKKAKELNKTVEEVKQIETTEKTEHDRLDKIAKEENRSIDEIKADEAKDKSIAERHGNDPVKIARALRKEQSEYGKIKNEIDGLRKFKEEVNAQTIKFNEQRFESQMENGRADIIEKFREKFPDESEPLSDDAVFERGKGLIRKGLEEKERVSNENIKTQAETKRADIIKTLPEEFKDFVPEIKELIEQCNNHQILDKEFDVAFLANYARGKKFTPDYVKSLVDDAYKRGVEQAKIIPKVPPGKPTNIKKENVSLTESQKTRAIEIYGRRDGWSQEKMFEEYFKNDLKSDSEW
jgi:hypothetical protein